MTIEIIFGWWLLPAAITIAAFWLSTLMNAEQNPNGNYGAYGMGAIYELIVHGAALIVSLAAWLIWSLFT